MAQFKGTNVLGKLTQGKEGSTVLLNGYVDAVQICEGWTKDP